MRSLLFEIAMEKTTEIYFLLACASIKAADINTTSVPDASRTNSDLLIINIAAHMLTLKCQQYLLANQGIGRF